jgi:nucleotide-binding universal stress UspA family protein
MRQQRNAHVQAHPRCHRLLAPGRPRVRAAVELAAFHGAALTALLVVPDYTTHEFAESVLISGTRPEALRKQLAKAGRVRLDRSLETISSDRPIERLVAVSDSPAEAIVERAKCGQCDLIVMTAHGRTALASAFLGSQTVRALALSQTPVLVVK